MGKAFSTVPCTLNKTTSRLFLKTWLGHQVLCVVPSPNSATPRPVARGFLSAIGTRLLPRLNERARPGEETELGIFAREGGPEEERDEPGAQGRELSRPLLPKSASGSGRIDAPEAAPRRQEAPPLPRERSKIHRRAIFSTETR